MKTAGPGPVAKAATEKELGVARPGNGLHRHKQGLLLRPPHFGDRAAQRQQNRHRSDEVTQTLAPLDRR